MPPNQDPDGDGQTFTLNLRFPGQYFDQETNLHYNYYRDYDPQIGRYVQSDPIGLDGGINTYAYVGSNPLKYYDSDGLDKWGAEPVFDWRTKAGVPLPDPYHPDLYLFTMCLRNCVKEPFVLTSTSEPTPQHKLGTPHRRGLAEDIRYPANPAKYLCCAKKCDAQYGQDEKRNPSPQATAAHFHLQLGPGRTGGSGDLPPDGQCEPCEGNKWQ
jgi:RHS repeat-associated protein